MMGIDLLPIMPKEKKAVRLTQNLSGIVKSMDGVECLEKVEADITHRSSDYGHVFLNLIGLAQNLGGNCVEWMVEDEKLFVGKVYFVHEDDYKR